MMRFSLNRLGFLLLGAAVTAGAQTVAQQALTMTAAQRLDKCEASAKNGSTDALEWCSVALGSQLTPVGEAYAYRYRAFAYEQQGNLEAALQDLDTAVDMATSRHEILDKQYKTQIYQVKNPELFFEQRARLYFKLKNFAAAAQDFTEVIRRSPTAPVYFNRGIIYSQMQNWDAAIADFSAAIQLDPNYVDSLKRRGIAYRSKKDSARALADFTEVSRLRPNDPDGPLNRGLIYTELGDFDRAVRELDAALALSPNDADLQKTRNAVATLKNAGSYVDANSKVVAGRRDVIKSEAFSDGLAAACIAEGQGCRWHYIDTTGKSVIRTNLIWTSGTKNFDAPPPFRDGLAATDDGAGKLAYMDKTGALVIRTDFPSIPFPDFNAQFYFNGDLGLVCGEFLPANDNGRPDMCGKYGYVDRTGKVVIPVDLTSPLEFSEGLTVVSRNGKDGYINNKNELVIPAKFDSAYAFSDGVAVASILQKYVLIDKTGKTLCALPKDNVYNVRYSEGLSPVVVAGRTGFMDKSCRIVIAAKYAQVSSFSEGLAAFQQDEKWGYMDKTGKVVAPAQYDEVYDFSEGLSAFRQGEMWGFLDNTGKVAIPAQMNAVYTGFKGGVAKVAQGGRNVFIDKTGTVVPDPAKTVAAAPSVPPAPGGTTPAPAAANEPPAPAPVTPPVNVDAQASAFLGKAHEFLKKGDPAGAIAEYRESLRLKPGNSDTRIGLALALMDTGQYEAAIPEAETVATNFPNAFWYRFYLVQALGGAGRMAEAETQLALAAKSGASPAAVQAEREALLGRDAAKKGDYAGAIPHFLKVNELTGGPKYDRVQIDLAVAAARTGQKDAALLILDEAVAESPYSLVLPAARQKLVAEMESATAAPPQNPATPIYTTAQLAERSIKAGTNAWGRSDYPSVVGRLSVAVRYEPENNDVLYRLGYALTKTGNPAAAVPHLQRAVEVYPGSDYYRLALGDALEQTGHREAALKELNTAIDLNPGYALFPETKALAAKLNPAAATPSSMDSNAALAAQHAGKGLSALQQLNSYQAIQSLQEAVRLQPENAVYQYQLGYALVGDFKNEAAVACFQRASELSPQNWVYLLRLAKALQSTGNNDGALRAIDRALSISPGNRALLEVREKVMPKAADVTAAQAGSTSNPADPNIALAAQAFEKGKLDWEKFAYAQAIPSFQEAVRLAPNNAVYHHQLGFALLVVKYDDPSAVVHLQKATELDPQKSEYFAHLGDALSSQGKKKDAVKAFDKGLALAPNDPYLLAGRNRALAKSK